MKEELKKTAGSVKVWAVHHTSDFFTNLVRDLKSLKALWNYLILMLFVWVCVWCVLYHAEICANTVIVTVGGLVGTIFTGYVWASTSEKKAAKQFPAYKQTTETTTDTPEGHRVQTVVDATLDDQNG